MLVPIADAYLWIGLCVAGAAFAGLALEVPTAPAPDARAVADTVDRVAAGRYPTRADHPVSATAIRVGPRRVALRSDGGTAHAGFAYGPVTPAGDGPLRRLLTGAPPDRVFDDPAALRVAAGRARNRTPRWRPADDRVRVRRVSWGGVDVTLVG